MGSIVERKRKDGSSAWRVQIVVRREGHIVRDGRTFEEKNRAKAWMAQREAEIASGHWAPRGHTLGSIIQRYIDEYEQVSNWGRSKGADLRRIQTYAIANHDVETLKSRHFVEHIMNRRKSGVAAATANTDLVWIRGALRVARAAWGYQIDLQELEDAAVHCRKNRLIDRSDERDRRPTSEELAALRKYFSRGDGRCSFDMNTIVDFAIESTRRQSEITRLCWEDYNPDTRVCKLLGPKDPKNKKQRKKIPFKLTQEAAAIIDAQPRIPGESRIFPIKPSAIRRRWERACEKLGIDDLHFHDLRREGTSRLFERGYQIHEVAQFTLHENWKNLQRYTQLRPEDLRDL